MKKSKHKKKDVIALVSDYFYPNFGGIETHILELATELKKKGYKVIVITHEYAKSGRCFSGVEYLDIGTKICKVCLSHENTVKHGLHNEISNRYEKPKGKVKPSEEFLFKKRKFLKNFSKNLQNKPHIDKSMRKNSNHLSKYFLFGDVSKMGMSENSTADTQSTLDYTKQNARAKKNIGNKSSLQKNVFNRFSFGIYDIFRVLKNPFSENTLHYSIEFYKGIPQYTCRLTIENISLKILVLLHTAILKKYVNSWVFRYFISVMFYIIVLNTIERKIFFSEPIKNKKKEKNYLILFNEYRRNKDFKAQKYEIGSLHMEKLYTIHFKDMFFPKSEKDCIKKAFIKTAYEKVDLLKIYMIRKRFFSHLSALYSDKYNKSEWFRKIFAKKNSRKFPFLIPQRYYFQKMKFKRPKIRRKSPSIFKNPSHIMHFNHLLLSRPFEVLKNYSLCQYLFLTDSYIVYLNNYIVIIVLNKKNRNCEIVKICIHDVKNYFFSDTIIICYYSMHSLFKNYLNLDLYIILFYLMKEDARLNCFSYFFHKERKFLKSDLPLKILQWIIKFVLKVIFVFQIFRALRLFLAKKQIEFDSIKVKNPKILPNIHSLENEYEIKDINLHGLRFLKVDKYVFCNPYIILLMVIHFWILLVCFRFIFSLKDTLHNLIEDISISSRIEKLFWNNSDPSNESHSSNHWKLDVCSFIYNSIGKSLTNKTIIRKSLQTNFFLKIKNKILKEFHVKNIFIFLIFFIFDLKKIFGLLFRACREYKGITNHNDNNPVSSRLLQNFPFLRQTFSLKKIKTKNLEYTKNMCKKCLLKVYYLKLLIVSKNTTFPTLLCNFPVFYKIFTKEKITIVHGHQSMSNLALEALYHASYLGLNTVFTEHSLFETGGVENIIVNKLTNFVFKNIDKIICVSQATKDNLLERVAVDENKVVVIPNGVNFYLFQNKKPKSKYRNDIENDTYPDFVQKGSFSSQGMFSYDFNSFIPSINSEKRSLNTVSQNEFKRFKRFFCDYFPDTIQKLKFFNLTPPFLRKKMTKFSLLMKKTKNQSKFGYEMCFINNNDVTSIKPLVEPVSLYTSIHISKTFCFLNFLNEIILSIYLQSNSNHTKNNQNAKNCNEIAEGSNCISEKIVCAFLFFLHDFIPLIKTSDSFCCTTFFINNQNSEEITIYKTQKLLEILGKSVFTRIYLIYFEKEGNVYINNTLPLQILYRRNQIYDLKMFVCFITENRRGSNNISVKVMTQEKIVDFIYKRKIFDKKLCKTQNNSNEIFRFLSIEYINIKNNMLLNYELQVKLLTLENSSNIFSLRFQNSFDKQPHAFFMKLKGVFPTKTDRGVTEIHKSLVLNTFYNKNVEIFVIKYDNQFFFEQKRGYYLPNTKNNFYTSSSYLFTCFLYDLEFLKIMPIILDEKLQNNFKYESIKYIFYLLEQIQTQNFHLKDLVHLSDNNLWQFRKNMYCFIKCICFIYSQDRILKHNHLLLKHLLNLQSCKFFPSCPFKDYLLENVINECLTVYFLYLFKTIHTKKFISQNIHKEKTETSERDKENLSKCTKKDSIIDSKIQLNSYIYDSQCFIDTQSQKMRRDPDEKINSVFCNSVDQKPTQNLKYLQNLLKDKITIVFCSRLVERKGIHILMKSLPLICNIDPMVRVLIVGDGDKKYELLQTIDEHFLNDQVIVIPGVSYSKVPQILNLGQIFLNTSLTESFCLAILEAAVSGLEIVSTNVGGVSEVLPSDCIFLTDLNPLNVAFCIKLAYDNVLKNNRDDLKLISLAKRKYKWSNISTQTAQIYTEKQDSKTISTLIGDFMRERNVLFLIALFLRFIIFKMYLSI